MKTLPLSILPSPRRLRPLVCLLALSCLLLGLLGGGAHVLGQVEEGAINREYPLKALFLYNFGGFVEWPSDAFPSAESPFVIGVLGRAPLEGTLGEIASTKKISGRKLEVKVFNSPAEVRACHILFIPRSVTPPDQQAAIENLKGQHVLIVGETDGFASQGASVNFFKEANKIRFEINNEAVKQQSLKVSAKLLSMARIVKTQ